MPRLNYQVIFLTLVLAIQLGWSQSILAVDGQMGVVTGNPGKIMDSDKVLAEVPQGTRLWMFITKDGWNEVKVPGQEQRGWMNGQAIEPVKLSEQQQGQLKEAATHLKEYQKLSAEKNYAAAGQSIDKRYQLLLAVHGAEHPDTNIALNNRGVVAYRQKDYPLARKFFDDSLVIYRKVLGNEHKETAIALSNLGILTRDQLDFPSAQKFFAEALAIQRNVLGNEHKETLASLNNLGYVVRKLGNYPAAKKFYDEVLAIQRKELGNEHASTATTIAIIGSLASDQNDYQTARKYLEEALTIQRKIHGNEHATTAGTLNGLGKIFSQQGDYVTARKYYEEALVIYRKVLGNEHASIAVTLNNLGLMNSRQGDNRAARKNYDEALAIYRKSLGNDHTETATTLNNLGILTRDEGNYPAARKFFEEAFAIKRKVLGAEHPETALALSNLGNLVRIQGDYTEAGQFLGEALAIQRKVYGGEHINIAHTINSLGILANNQGDYPAAQKYHDEALAIYRKLLGNENSYIATTFSCLGNLSLSQGDYPSARRYYDDALTIQRKVLGNEHSTVATVLVSLAVLAQEQGDYATARKFYDQALAMQRKILGTEHAYIADSLNGLGILAYRQKDYPTARKFYDEAIAIARKSLGEDHIKTVNILHNLGALVADQGDYPSARKYLDEALSAYRKVLGNEHAGTAKVLNRLGDLHILLGDHRAAYNSYDESSRIYRRVFGKDHPNTTNALSALARLAVLDGDDDVAQRNFDDIRRIQRRYVRYLLPALSAPEQLSYLENNYRRAWHQSLSYGIRQPENATLSSLSVAWIVNGKAVGDEALAARELLARDTANPDLAPLVKELQEVRQQLGSQSLTAVKPEQANAHQAKLTELTAREFRLAQQLADATGESFVDVDWIESGKFRRVLASGSIYIDIIRMSIDPIDLKLKSKVDSAPHYIAWIILPQGEGKVQFQDLGEAAPIDAAIEKLMTNLAGTANKQSVLSKDGEAAATTKLDIDLQAVTDLVLKPLLPHLKEKKELILSPDGTLWLLPWAALPIAESKRLLEQCSIRYTLSGRDLFKKANNAKLGTTTPAIIVNPDYDLAGPAAKAALQKVSPNTTSNANLTNVEVNHSSLPRVSALPLTAFEGHAAKPSLALLAKSEPILYEQGQALEAVVKKLQRPKHLLLSTHGFFLPDQELKSQDDKLLLANNDTRAVPVTTEGKPVENPLLRCGLLLAGCNSPRTAGMDDGILTGLEIVGMDLRGTELVVLSACETGIGKVRNGEGVAGLRQAFQLAGAQSVVSTLWQVPDRDSAIIMQDFFKNLAAGQSKAEALRNAQLTRIAARKDKFGAAHPFFWAAWTVTGE